MTTKIGLYPWGSSAGNVFSVFARKALGKVVPQLSLPVVNWKIGCARISLRDSLKRLRSDYVDFLLLHEPDESLLEADELLNWLCAERACGNIRAWGVAGVARRVMPWVLNNHPLAAVVQTQDSIDKHQADFMFEANRRLQFTYGYLSGNSVARQIQPIETTLREALRRNSSGSVLISTRRATNLANIVSAIT